MYVKYDQEYSPRMEDAGELAIWPSLEQVGLGECQKSLPVCFYAFEIHTACQLHFSGYF